MTEINRGRSHLEWTPALLSDPALQQKGAQIRDSFGTGSPITRTTFSTSAGQVIGRLSARTVRERGDEERQKEEKRNMDMVAGSAESAVLTGFVINSLASLFSRRRYRFHCLESRMRRYPHVYRPLRARVRQSRECFRKPIRIIETGNYMKLDKILCYPIGNACQGNFWESGISLTSLISRILYKVHSNRNGELYETR